MISFHDDGIILLFASCDIKTKQGDISHGGSGNAPAPPVSIISATMNASHPRFIRLFISLSNESGADKKPTDSSKILCPTDLSCPSAFFKSWSAHAIHRSIVASQG